MAQVLGGTAMEAPAPPAKRCRVPERVCCWPRTTRHQVVARHMLSALGCEVPHRANGREALDAVRSGPYDLVLMDCRLPVMDGFCRDARDSRMGSRL